MLLQFDANNSLSIIWQKVSFATAEVGETDQFVKWRSYRTWQPDREKEG